MTSSPEVQVGVGIRIADESAIPPGIDSLEDFRRSALSDEFPEKGRIDYARGTIEIDDLPERVSSHGEVKVEVGRVLSNRVKRDDLGKVQIDQTRVSDPSANLSTESDLLVLRHETIESGHVRRVPTTEGRDSAEVEGGPDLVVEIVSPSSVGKDTRRLPPAYFDAGVAEHWLIDAQRDEIAYRLFRRGRDRFEELPPDAEGFRRIDSSGGATFERRRGRRDEWRYDLREAE